MEQKKQYVKIGNQEDGYSIMGISIREINGKKIFHLDESGITLEMKKIESSLPGNPATLKTFVGRYRVLSDLWHWLFYTRDSRRFLWGDGGSGKTTIAFEFASMVIENAAGASPRAAGFAARYCRPLIRTLPSRPT